MNDMLPHLLPHLWQSTVFGLIIVGVLLALPKAPARVRYVAGWFGLAKFLLPLGLISTAAPALNIISETELLARIGLQPVLQPEFVVYAHRPAARAVATAAVTDGVNWVSLAIWSWAAVTVLLMVIGLVRSFWMSRRALQGAVPFDADHANRLAGLAGSLGLNPGRVHGYFTGSPTLLGVVGLFRSRILVPRNLVSSLARDEVEAVLLHELAHVRRRDNLWHLLQAGVVGLLWFHPVVWWLHRRLLWESERACDELVLSAQRNQQTYAEVLLKAARFALGLGMPGVSGMSRMRLQPRVQAILNHQARKDSVMKTTGLLLLLGGAFVVCSVSAQMPTITEPSLTEREKVVLEDVKAAMEENNHLDALGLLQDYLTNENAHSPAVLFNAGLVYLNMGDAEQGAAHLESALVEYPDFARARRILMVAEMQLGKFTEAVEHGEQYLAQFGVDDDHTVYGLLGLGYSQSGDFERAVDNYEVAVELNPEESDWKFGLANAYVQTKQHEKLIGICEELLEANPEDLDLWQLISYAARKLGDDERAVEYLAKAQALSDVTLSADTPVDPDQFDVAPVPKWRPYPEYPRELKAEGTEGRVVVAFTVTTEGKVDYIEVESATHEAFESAVVNVLKGWRYDPGTKDGEPVDVRMKLPITFKIGTPPEETAEATEAADAAG